MSINEYVNYDEFDESDEILSETQQLKKHKILKLEVLEQLCVKLSDEDKNKIINAKTIGEVDRIGRSFIMSDRQLNRRPRRKMTPVEAALCCM